MMRWMVALVQIFCSLVLSYVAYGQDVSRIITREISRSISDAVSGEIEARFIRPTLKIQNEISKLENAVVNSAGTYLALNPSGNLLRVWSLETGVQVSEVEAPKGNVTAFDVSETGEYLWVGNSKGWILGIPPLGRQPRLEFKSSDPVTALAVSERSGVIVTGHDDGGLRIWKVPSTGAGSNKPVHEAKLGRSNIDLVALSTDGSRVAAVSAGSLWVLEVSSGQVLVKPKLSGSRISGLQFASEGQGLAAAIEDGSVWLLDDQGRETHKRSRIAKPVLAAFSGDLAMAALSDNAGSVHLLDLKRNRVVRKFDVAESPLVALWLDASGKRVLTARRTGRITLWDVETGKWLVQVISTATGWSVLDALGRFDGSESGFEDVSWVLGERELSLNSFAQRYFEPGLLANHIIVGTEFLNVPPMPLEEGVPPPPVVEIDIPDGERQAGEPVYVVVIAQDEGGGIDTVRLYHNGKLAAPGALMQQQDIEEGETHLRAAAFRVDPVPGINTLKAVANGLWEIEGYSKRYAVEFKGEAAAPRLHIVTVGINQYKDERLKLNYSVPDARAIGDFFRSAPSGSAFSEVLVHSLLDEEATKEAILDRLGALVDAGQEDVVVVYLAGHGLVIDREWVFLPYESPYTTRLTEYLTTALTAQEIQSALVGSGAQRVLVMIDSCQAGAGAAAFGRYKSFQRRFMRELSRISGITVLAATREDQFAAEVKTLGHGLFTHIVLGGLEGNADFQPADGRVTAYEIVNYSASAIRTFTKKYGIRQEPVAYALGADFILSGASR